MSNSEPSEMEDTAPEQGPLLTAVAELEESLEPLGLDGQGQLGVDWEAQAIDLYWKGGVPAPAEALLKTLHLGFPVRLHASQFSLDDLYTASMRLTSAMESDKSLGQIVGIAIRDDLEGLTIFTAREQVDTESLTRGISGVLRKDIPLDFVYKSWAAHTKPRRVQ